MKLEDKILEVKKSRVLEAAKLCNDTKKVLKVLFPEVFAETEYLIGTTFMLLEGEDDLAYYDEAPDKLILVDCGNRVAKLIDMDSGLPVDSFKISLNKVAIQEERLAGYAVQRIPNFNKASTLPIKVKVNKTNLFTDRGHPEEDDLL